MAFPFAIAIGGVIELIKIGTNILEKQNNGTLTQAEFDAEWAKMQANLKNANDKWEASKRQRGQT